MRSWLLFAGVALIGVAAALAVASDGWSVAFKQVTVTLTPTGPSPRTITRSPSPLVSLSFVNTDSVAHKVVFAGGHCSFDVPPGGEGGCRASGPTRVGTYHYTVDGTFPGTVHVVGLFRAVTIGARTDTIKLGRRVKLQGRLTFDSEGPGFCGPRSGAVLLLLARHGRGQPFKRIAMFPVAGQPDSKRTVNDRCSYGWQREVRPGLSTT